MKGQSTAAEDPASAEAGVPLRTRHEAGPCLPSVSACPCEMGKKDSGPVSLTDRMVL